MLLHDLATVLYMVTLVSVTVKFVYGLTERCILSNIFQSLAMLLI